MAELYLENVVEWKELPQLLKKTQWEGKKWRYRTEAI
jgi:hypothetical protein